MSAARELTAALRGSWSRGKGLARCPAPGHGRGRGDRNPSLSIADGDADKVLVCCHAGCDQRAVINALQQMGLWQGAGRSQPQPRPAREPAADNRSGLPALLWERSAPLAGTPGELYLRQGRGIGCTLPPTLRYLPASRKHSHAMIGAFGLVEEEEPGMLASPGHVQAVHLTRLAPDGLSRVEKRMMGPVSGSPLVLAPVNDGLGLVLTEGIEDALSIHEATGLGAWAGGSAGHLAKLAAAIPDWVECVTIAEDDNEAGRRASRSLADACRARGFEVRILRLDSGYGE